MSVHVGNNWLFSTNTELDLKQLREKNRKMQNELIQENSWISRGENNHPLGDIPQISVDLNTLGLLDGKSFIAGTSLENCDMGKGLEYFHAFATCIVNKHEEINDRFTKQKFSSHLGKITRFRNDVEDAISMNNEMTSLIKEGLENPNERTNLVNAYAGKIRLKFKNKKQIWLPCSWEDTNNVLHSMMINIDMEKGTVILVNAGKDIEEHHPRVNQTSLDPLTGTVKEDEKFQEFIKISGIDKKRLNHIDFFKYLIEIQTTKAWYGNNKEISGKNFYESIPAYLEGSVESGISPIDHPEVFKKKDGCNSGSMKCLSTMLYYTLSGAFEEANNDDGIASYKQLKYLWQTHALVSFFRNLKETLSSAEWKLLKDITENVSRIGDKLYKDSLLSEQDLAVLHATLVDIKSKLAAAQINSEEVKKTDPVACHLSQPIPEEVGRIQVSIKADIRNNLWDVNNQVIQKSPLEDALKDLGKAQFSFKSEEVSSTLNNLQNIRKIFQNSCQNVRLLVLNRQLENTQKAAARKIILDKLAQFVCELPDPSDSFWNNIPPEQITQCMEEVYSIMQILKGTSSFVFQNRWNEGYSAHEADVTAMLYGLYFVNVRLARLQKENCLEGFDLYHDLLAEVKSPSFMISNSRLQQKLQRVISYFCPKYDLKSQVKETDPIDRLEKRMESLFSFKSYIGVGAIHSENSKLDDIATFKYYKQFLKNIDPEFATRLYDPEHGGQVIVPEDYWEDTPLGRRLRTRMVHRTLRPSDTEIQKLEALIGDRNRCNENRLLPKSIYLLQDSSLLCSHHHFVSGQNPVISDFDHLGQNDHFSLNVELGNQHQQDRTITVKVNNLYRYYYERGSEIEDQYLQKQEEEFDYDFNDYVMSPLRRMKKQNSFIPAQKKLFGLELDASRELQMIGVDPYDAAARVIGFGRRNVDFLKNKFILYFFRLQLFRNGQLLSQMEDKPAFAKSIGDFFINAIQHHQQKNDLETCLSLAKLGNDVKVFITQAGYHDIALPDFRKIVREELIKQVDENGKSQKTKWSEKRKIYETLVTFSEKIEEEYLVKDTCLQSEAALDILGFLIAKNMEGQAAIDNEITTTILLRYKPLLIEHIQDGTFFDRDEIFNSAIKLIDPRYKGKSAWQGGPRVYHNDNYIIDIEEGSVIDKQTGRIGTVPSAIINNEDFKKIFAGSIETCKQKGSAYIINEGLENELIVFSTLDDQIGFERQIKGKTYRYVSIPQELEQQTPILADPKLCYWICDESDQKRFMVAFKDGEKGFKSPS